MGQNIDYAKISLPKAMTKKIEKYIKANPELGYKSIADFIKDVIREEFDEIEEKNSLLHRVKELEKALEQKLSS